MRVEVIKHLYIVQVYIRFHSRAVSSADQAALQPVLCKQEQGCGRQTKLSVLYRRRYGAVRTMSAIRPADIALLLRYTKEHREVKR